METAETNIQRMFVTWERTAKTWRTTGTYILNESANVMIDNMLNWYINIVIHTWFTRF